MIPLSFYELGHLKEPTGANKNVGPITLIIYGFSDAVEVVFEDCTVNAILNMVRSSTIRQLPSNTLPKGMSAILRKMSDIDIGITY